MFGIVYVQFMFSNLFDNDYFMMLFFKFSLSLSFIKK